MESGLKKWKSEAEREILPLRVTAEVNEVSGKPTKPMGNSSTANQSVGGRGLVSHPEKTAFSMIFLRKE
jgi:hypothetical protein